MKTIIEQTIKGKTVSLIRTDKPIYGGYYEVIMSGLGKTNLKKDGLTLDAAKEVYKETLSAIEQFS
jgi:hypothetical protein